METNMEANKCPNCGASINERDEQITTCKYCGGTIINKAAKEEQKAVPAEQSHSTTIFNTSQPPINKINLKFNGLVFFLLLIFAWPIAIVYLILSKGQKK